MRAWSPFGRLRLAACAAQEARWLIRSLEIRNETLLKVARSIVQRQAAFLERGDEAMQPMILRDVPRRSACTSRRSRA
jgi:DNA-directed RNA polymerase specialized sigma54-like protein